MSSKQNLSLKIVTDVLDDLKSFTSDSRELAGLVAEGVPYLRMMGVVKNIWDYHKERKMKKFLEGLAKKLNDNGGYSTDDQKRLKEFLSHDYSKEKFFGILDEALNSVSEICCEILGYFAGEILLSSQKLDYQSSVIINALRNMNDWDIKNFQRAYEALMTISEGKSLNAACMYLNLPLEQYIEVERTEGELMKDEDFREFRSSLMKISNLQVLNTDGMIFANDGVTYIRGRIGDKLYDLVNVFVKDTPVIEL